MLFSGKVVIFSVTVTVVATTTDAAFTSRLCSYLLGGLDSTVLAALADRFVPADQPIEYGTAEIFISIPEGLSLSLSYVK